MPSFEGGLFGLGYGSPLPPSEDPNTSKTERLISQIEEKILDGVIDRLRATGGQIASVDSLIENNLNEIILEPTHIMKRFDSQIVNGVGAEVEQLAAKVNPLIHLAKEAGINLEEVSNSGRSEPTSGGLFNSITRAFDRQKPDPFEKSKVDQWGVPTRPSPDPSDWNVVAGAPGQVAPNWLNDWLSDSGFRPGHIESVMPTGPNSWLIRPDPSVIPGNPFAVTENTPLPSDIQDIIHPFGEDFQGTPFPRDDPGVFIPPDEGIEAVDIDVSTEMPVGEPLPVPAGDDTTTTTTGQEISGGSCPPTEVHCGDCLQAPCICQGEPVPGQQVAPGIQTTIAETVTNIENQLTEVQSSCPDIQIPEPVKPIWCAYCNPITGNIFVVPPGQTNPNPAAKLIACAPDENTARMQAVGRCWQKDVPPSPLKYTLEFPDITGLCHPHSYALNQTLDFVWSSFQRQYPFQSMLGFNDSESVNQYDAWLKGLGELFPQNKPIISLARTFVGWFQKLDDISFSLMTPYESAGVDFALCMVSRMIIGFLETWVSADFSKFKQPFKYKTDAIVPQLFPSEADATSAYIVGAIDKPTWQLWLAMNNYCFEPYSKLEEVARSKFAPTELLNMKRRQVIADSTYRQEFRASGFMDDLDPDRFERAGKFIPPIQDLVRFMVRDVFDPAVVSNLKLDQGFNDKWVGEALQWGQYQGIDPEVAKKYWQAHWVIPSPGQLFDIFNRNKLESPPGEPVFDDIALEETLKQQDYAPQFIPYLMQISKHMMTRVDMRRAYRLGSVDEIEVRRNYIGRGYSDENADTLVDYAKSDKEQYLLGRPEVKLYKKGMLSEIEFKNALEKYNPTLEQWTYVHSIARQERRAPIVKKCIREIEKAYLNLEIDDTELAEKLDELEVNDTLHGEIVEQLACVKKSQSKELSASKLCELFTQAIITRNEFRERLMSLKYDFQTATEIIISCQWKINQRQARVDQQAAQAAEKERAKQAKEEARAFNAAIRDAARAAKMRQKRKLAEDRREVRILKVINKLAKCNGVDIEIAGGLVRSALVSINSLYDFTSEERTTILERTVEQCEPKTAFEFNEQWSRLASEFARLEPLDLNHGSGGVSTNPVNRIQTERNNGSVG